MSNHECTGGNCVAQFTTIKQAMLVSALIKHTQLPGIFDLN